MSTFNMWFANTEILSLMKNPKVTSGKLNIEVNINILKHLEVLNKDIEDSGKLL